MTSAATAVPLFRPAGEGLRFLPEGPLPLGPGRAAWVAIQHGADATDGSLNLLDLRSGDHRSVSLPGRPGFAARTSRDDLFLIGLDQEIVLVDLGTATPNVIPTGLRVRDDGPTLINDGIATPFGIVFGTKDPQFKDPIAGLYLLRQSDGRLIKLAGGKTCSNGKAAVRDEQGWVLFTVDTAPRTVTRYRLDVESGRVRDEQVWLDLCHEAHYPDGLRLAPTGDRVAMAFYHPGDGPDGLVRQYRLADAAIDQEWRVPGSPRVTCPAYVEVGGAVKLLITTAVEGMPDQVRVRCPEAGTLFLADTGFAAPIPPADTFNPALWGL